MEIVDTNSLQQVFSAVIPFVFIMAGIVIVGEMFLYSVLKAFKLLKL